MGCGKLLLIQFSFEDSIAPGVKCDRRQADCLFWPRSLALEPWSIRRLWATNIRSNIGKLTSASHLDGSGKRTIGKVERDKHLFAFCAAYETQYSGVIRSV